MKNKNRYFLSEFIGSCFLVMIIVGSGLMAENLTDDTAIMLIANTLATGAGLFVLITVFADVSGAHFNPFVSIAMTITGKLKKNLLPFYISAQILGCLLGVALANFFFEHQVIELSTNSRNGIYIFTSEIVATLGLILVIFGPLKILPKMFVEIGHSSGGFITTVLPIIRLTATDLANSDTG